MVLLKSNHTDKLLNFLLFFFVLFIPTQAAIHFWPTSSLVNGIRVDYLSPTIYLTDILIVAILFLVYSKKANRELLKTFLKTNKLFLTSILLFSIANTALSVNPLTSFLKYLKIGELALLVFGLVNLKSNFETLIKKPLTISLIIVVAIGFFQVLLGRTLGGALYLLGERTFNVYTPGISLINFWGATFLKMYSIFPHPNALGGYLIVLLPFLFTFLKKEKKLLNWIAILFCLVGIILTFSINVYLSFVLAVILFFIIKNTYYKNTYLVAFSVAIFLFSFALLIYASKFSGQFSFLSESVGKRLMLANIGGLTLSSRPYFGAGLNSFLYLIPKYSYLSGNVWFLQPIHNIYLLILTETGIVGFMYLFWLTTKLLIKSAINNNSIYLLMLILIILTGFNDHYWLTSQQNLLLASLIISLILRNNNKTAAF